MYGTLYAEVVEGELSLLEVLEVLRWMIYVLPCMLGGCGG
jgi:hypothetical protein